MRRKLLLLVLLVVVLGTSVVEGNVLRISPEMELMAGVLSQTSWIEKRGPTGSGNEYFRALQDFFAPYQDHRAVTLTEEMLKKGFAYDAPPAFICHLGPLPELGIAYEYSDYLVGRAKGRENLEELRIALSELAAEADFLSFYAAWKPYLDETLEPYLADFRFEHLEEWLQGFFGWSPDAYQLIITPSMFPGGGYGASVTDALGHNIAFQIVREYGASEGRPEFPSGVTLEDLTVHELGHAFVNPSLEAYPEKAKKLRPLLWPVRKIMKDQAYGTVAGFLNEQVIRSMEVLAARDLFEPEMETTILEHHEKWGFYLTRFVLSQLEYYQAHRAQYPLFTDFVPYLYEQLALYQKEHSPWQARLFGHFLR